MPRLITDVLAELRQGGAVQELTEAYAAVVDGVVEHGKKGTVTLTLSIEPQSKVDAFTVLVVDKIKATVPAATRTGSIFYAENDGSLVRHDSRQPRLPIREVPDDRADPIDLEETSA